MLRTIPNPHSNAATEDLSAQHQPSYQRQKNEDDKFPLQQLDFRQILPSPRHQSTPWPWPLLTKSSSARGSAGGRAPPSAGEFKMAEKDYYQIKAIVP